MNRRTEEQIRHRAQKLGIQQEKHFTQSIYKIDPVSLKVINSYNSIKDAVNDGFSRAAIIQVCQRKMRTSGGYCWCYKKDWSSNWKPIDTKFLRKEQVYCWDTKQIFNNAKEASNLLNIPYELILKCCAKKSSIAYNLHFCYLKDKDTFIPIFSNADEHEVICINTGHRYKSIAEASRLTQTSASGISSCCRGIGKTANNLTWCYIEDYKESMQPKKHSKPINAKYVYQYDKTDGHYIATFSSTGDAARSLNKDTHTNIFCACSGKSKTAYGYKWSYIKADNYNDIPK